MERVKHGGKWIEFKRSFHRPDYFNRKTRCAICNKIVAAKSIIFLVNLIKSEKELVIHEECVQPPAPFDKNNSFVWAVAKLHERWKEAQKWAAWF